MKITKAMILCAGFGTRLHPLTLSSPKPLLKIGDNTLLSNTLSILKKFGIKQVVINVHYLGDQIIDYVKRNEFNMAITTVSEKDKILDTGGGVLNAHKCFLLVVNKNKSFDQSFKGDFNLENNLINRKDIDGMKYIYTGVQIIKPDVFDHFSQKVFSINKIWDKLIQDKVLFGKESNINFLHVSTTNIYKSLLDKYFKH